jgi:hypothetical protein
MIDPTLSLAFAVHSNKGAYALLLGSGVSRAAGIPTGWEVVQDLIRKLAALAGEDAGAAPEAWYISKHGEEPDYANLLESLAKLPAERNQLLRSYFEPSEEEKERGLKLPTQAHQAIAELVSEGFVRVIVTTNFDRLLEKALEQAGVTPAVISTDDAAKGSLPIAHTGCCVLKAHGDYLDTRIKNTPEELGKLDQHVSGLLDRIFDEYGLIVCGWSAEWDTGLRGALERCQSRRFTTYWAARGELSEAAKTLVALRQAQVIPIADADSFFRSLAEKVGALTEISRSHPASAKVAAQLVKRYIVDDRNRIRLHDLMMEEVGIVCAALDHSQAELYTREYTPDEIVRRRTRYEALVGNLLPMLVEGCYWGDERVEAYWVRAIERLANAAGREGVVEWRKLRLYPALLSFYASGMASIAGGKFRTLLALFSVPRILAGRREEPAVRVLQQWEVTDKDVWKQLPGLENHYTPASDHLFGLLREPLSPYLPEDTRYEECFDRFECLLALTYADLSDRDWVPVGRFAWKAYSGDNPPLKLLQAESGKAGPQWPPLVAGMFGGSIERLNAAMIKVETFVGRLGWY